MMLEQAAETYAWYVIYRDQTGHHEFDLSCFADVDQEHVQTLMLLQATEIRHLVDVPEGAQPIFFRRRSIEINALTSEGTPRPTVHCIGWRQGDAAVYLFVFEDGSTLLSNDLQAI
jgi:hypothetical protein